MPPLAYLQQDSPYPGVVATYKPSSDYDTVLRADATKLVFVAPRPAVQNVRSYELGGRLDPVMAEWIDTFRESIQSRHPPPDQRLQNIRCHTGSAKSLWYDPDHTRSFQFDLPTFIEVIEPAGYAGALTEDITQLTSRLGTLRFSSSSLYHHLQGQDQRVLWEAGCILAPYGAHEGFFRFECRYLPEQAAKLIAKEDRAEARRKLKGKTHHRFFAADLEPLVNAMAAQLVGQATCFRLYRSFDRFHVGVEKIREFVNHVVAIFGPDAYWRLGAFQELLARYKTDRRRFRKNHAKYVRHYVRLIKWLEAESKKKVKFKVLPPGKKLRPCVPASKYTWERI